MNNYGLGILIQAKDQASATFQRVEKNFQSLSKKSDELASRMQASSRAFFAGAGMMGGGAALLGGVGATVKVAGDFEEAMLGVQKTTGMADEDLKKLAGRFVSMSAKMPSAARELAGIGEIGGQLGITGVDNLAAFTDTVAKLASVSEFSAEEGGAALAKISNQFRIPIQRAKNMGSVLNELSNISTATAPTVADLTSRMAGAGATVGLTMPQIAAIGASLTDMGISAEVGGTAMSDLFMEMMKRTDEYAKVAGMSTASFKAHMEKDALGALLAFTRGLQGMDKFQVAGLLTDLGIGGARGTDVLLKLVEATKSVNGQQSLLGRFVGTANRAFSEGTSLQREYDNALRGMNAQLKVAWNSVVALAIGVGEQLAPHVTKAAKSVSSFLRGLNAWAKENPRALRGIVLLAAALGGLLVAGGAVLTLLGAVGMLSVGLSALPLAAGALGGVAAAILPILSVVAAVAAAGYFLYKAWTTNFLGVRDVVLPILQKLKSGFSSFMKEHGDRVMAFAGAAGKIVGAVLAVSGAIRIVKGAVSGAIGVWRMASTSLRVLNYGFHAARAYAAYYGQAILKAMRSTLSFARTAAVQAAQGVKKLALSLAAGARKAAVFSFTLIKTAVKAVASFAVSVAVSAVTAIGAFASALVPAIAAAWSFAAALMANPITWIVLGVVAVIAAIVLLIKNWDKVKAVAVAVWGAIVSFIKAGAQRLKAVFAAVTDWIVDAFSKAWVWLKGFVVKWWPFILGVFTGGIGTVVGLVIQNWDKIAAFFKGIAATVSGWISSVFASVASRIDAARQAVLSAVAAIQLRWGQFRAAVASVWSAISAAVGGAVDSIRARVQSAVSFLSTIWNGLKNAVGGVWDGIVQKIAGAIASIKAKLIGLIPEGLRAALGTIGVRIPAPTAGPGKFQQGGFVAKTGGVSAVLHQGEVIAPAPAVQKIVRHADMIAASGIRQTPSGKSETTTINNHISISLPNVREVDRRSVEELADLIIRKIEYMQKRKREAAFSNDFNPSLSAAGAT